MTSTDRHPLPTPAALRAIVASVVLCVGIASASAAAVSGAWTDKGGGLAGTAGIPQLSGSGDLVPGTPGFIELSSAAPSAPLAIFFSLLEVGVPLKGGTLSAYPPLLVLSFSTDATGTLLLPWSAWPNVLPPGIELYFQVAVGDAAAPKGAAISNLLMGVTG